MGVALSKLGKLEEAQQIYSQVLQLNETSLFAFCNDAELALVQRDNARCKARIQQGLVIADNKTQKYVILLFLAWLADPNESFQAVLDAIKNLDPEVVISWDFSDIEPAIARLNPEQQHIARQFVAYFEGKSYVLPASS